MERSLYAGEGLPKLIPKIIHQTYKSTRVPDNVKPFMASWRTQNQDWEIRFYDDAACLAFVQREFPEYLHAYVSLPKDVERSDFFRQACLCSAPGKQAARPGSKPCAACLHGSEQPAQALLVPLQRHEAEVCDSAAELWQAVALLSEPEAGLAVPTLPDKQPSTIPHYAAELGCAGQIYGGPAPGRAVRGHRLRVQAALQPAHPAARHHAGLLGERVLVC